MRQEKCQESNFDYRSPDKFTQKFYEWLFDNPHKKSYELCDHEDSLIYN